MVLNNITMLSNIYFTAPFLGSENIFFTPSKPNTNQKPINSDNKTIKNLQGYYSSSIWQIL